MKMVFVPYALPLRRGVLVDRVDRFIAVVQLDGDREVRAHCINPGRMENFVVPGAVVWVRPEPPESRRALRWTWELIERDGVWCSTNTQRPNLIVGEALRNGAVSGIRGSARAEVSVGKSRFDFCVGEHLIEVKNSHAVYSGWGYFPDSVSERAARHCEELGELASSRKCTVVIVAQREDAIHGIRSSWYHDPGFAEAALEASRRGVEFRGLRVGCDPTGSTVLEEIPVDLRRPERADLVAVHRAWLKARPFTGWTRAFDGNPRRVANGPFKHNARLNLDDDDDEPRESPFFASEKRTRKRRYFAAAAAAAEDNHDHHHH
ncbi:hypothetical protein CTAYLR_001532 [Chrysophaeum taylorii]|uniref:Sugar fermentation stimulation protein homolog n=1 Tax=Chrysophaeum taylorii TaxID=2483200 RepID=A0AAD7UE44_9STRA|nr:hypothetical protein CTAYLR_001532 [Chrysophaeum taylorii]